jgi:hypothetical protein
MSGVAWALLGVAILGLGLLGLLLFVGLIQALRGVREEP